MSMVSDASETAKAMVSASLLYDHQAITALMPDDRSELIHLILALTNLNASTLESLARDRDQEPVEVWRAAMLAVATEST